jgi:serine protease inhibitor
MTTAYCSTSVEASNDLTSRWCSKTSGDFVLSGCGLWPLLALLADAAEGEAREELAHAIGIPAGVAKTQALLLLNDLQNAEAVEAALGVWVRDDLVIRDEWAAGLPAGTIDRLTNQSVLDAWANEHTKGLIDRFPLDITADTLMMLATALAAKTQWYAPFTAMPLTPTAGPWKGHQGAGMQRYEQDIHAISALNSWVTRVIVEGDHELDVHLLMGEGDPSEVLATGISALSGTVDVHHAASFPHGSPPLLTGVQITPIRAVDDNFTLKMPPIDLRNKINLLDNADLFGLRTACTDLLPAGHFPAISASTPLKVEAAAQDVLARFNETGFEAAAVTAIGIMRCACAMAPPMPRPALSITATYDRPFGFIAVDRMTNLVLVAGWVDQPPQ